MEPRPPAVEAQSLNHWSTREVPIHPWFASHTITLLIRQDLQSTLNTLSSSDNFLADTSLTEVRTLHLAPHTSPDLPQNWEPKTFPFLLADTHTGITHAYAHSHIHSLFPCPPTYTLCLTAPWTEFTCLELTLYVHTLPKLQTCNAHLQLDPFLEIHSCSYLFIEHELHAHSALQKVLERQC